MVKYWLILTLLIMKSLLIQAQISIKGKAVDNKTGLGIGFVTVHLLSSADSSLIQGQITDSAGIFQLPGIPPGRYTLRLLSIGYKKLYKVVLQEAGNLTDLGAIPLEPETSLLNEVIVSGGKPPFQRLADKLVLNISGNRLFAGAVNTYDILKKVPGVEVTADGAIQMAGGVTPAIFIDGKLMPMSPEELQTYLSGLSSDMIASIELIANPSGKYGGEYKGLIDIRLKRDMTLGWKGNANVSFQQNNYSLADNNLSLTYKTRKLAYTARLGYTTGTRIRRYEALQHQASTNIMTTHTEWPTGNNNINLQLGVDYSLKDGQQLELVLRTYQQDQDVNFHNTLHTTDATARKVVSNTNTRNNFSPRQHNYTVQLNYTARLGATRLEMQGAMLKIGNRQNEDIQTRRTSTGHLLDHWKTALQNDIMIRMAQADLSRDLGKGKLGAGARFAFTTTKNDLHYDTLNTANIFVPDSGRTNNFQYDEYITAAYLSYEGTANKLNYAISLRVEHTHSIANAVTLHQVNKQDYLKWLPAFSFTYAPGENRQLNLSYSRRITRPGFDQLNPFRFYISPLNYFIGNPDLQPSTTSMLSLAYTQTAFNVSLYAGRESDVMTRYPEYDSVTNILEYLGKNLPYKNFAGIEVSIPLSVNKWWRMSHNIRGYYKKELMPYHDVTYAIPVMDYTISGSQVFTIPHDIIFDISYTYRSISGNSLYIAKPAGSLDLGLQKNWLKGKISSRINFYDIFDTNKVWFIFREKRIIDNELHHWFGNRKLAVTLGYNFGTSTHKARQRNKNDEEIRAEM